MPARFFLTTDDVNAFNADQWLSDQNKKLADDWLGQQMEQLNAGLGAGTSPQAAPQPPQAPSPEPVPATPAEPSVPPEPAQAPQGLTPDSPVLDLSKPPVYAPDAPIVTPSPSRAVTPTVSQSPVAAPSSTPTFAPTTASLSGGGKDLGLTDRAKQILSGAVQSASWLGPDAQKAIQAILVTEGGLNNARGDNGSSAGPLQFFGEEGGRSGQLNAFAQAHGMTLSQARSYIEQHPDEAIRWAIGTPDQPGYLGRALLNGINQGLGGADLATFGQRTGQVSVSPERAGQNFQSLFGGGGQPNLIPNASTSTPSSSGYAFPVVGAKTPVQNHWGEVKGGSDIFAPRGTPVVAMRGGKVLESGWNDVGGNSVLIQGDDGNQYYYAHFDATPSVGVGDHVTPGTYLGPVGNTGDAQNTGTHLHIGIGPSILLGADKYGGTGGDFDAVGLLRATQADGWMADTLASDSGPTKANGPKAIAQAAPQPDDQRAASVRQPTGLEQVTQPFADAFRQVGDVVGGALSATGAKVQNPQTGNPVLDTLGTGASVIGTGAHTVLSPFSGASEFFPTGGPLAGPIIGGLRTGAGYEQMGREGATEAERQLRDLTQRQDAGEPGLDAQIDYWASVYDQATHRGGGEQATFEAAQRNPSIGTLEGLGGVAQGIAAAPLAAEGMPLAAKAVAAVIDPQTGLPAVAGRAIEAAGPALRSRQAAQANVDFATGGASRFFHGTGADFPRPDKANFDPNGLFGPGYYVTSSPEVAASYAKTRAPNAQSAEILLKEAEARLAENPADTFWQERVDRLRQDLASGSNVRAVDVPKNLNLFDAEAPADSEVVRQLDNFHTGSSQSVARALEDLDNPTNGDLYNAMDRTFTGYGGKRTVNQILASVGYDGIQYAGGKRIPMADAAGAPIEHTAAVVFPNSLDKIRNAISGQQGGQALAPFAARLGGAATGGATGYATTPEDASPQERAARTLGGAALGFGATYGAGRIIENPALLRARQRAMADPNFASGGLGNLIPEGKPTVERPTGAPATPEQLQSTIDSLGQQWQDLDNEIRSLYDQAASAFNPGLRQQLTNRAQMLQKNQDDVLRTVQYIDEHNALPVGVNPAAGLAETIPEQVLPPTPVQAPSAGPSSPRATGASTILASPNFKRLQAMRGTPEQQAALRPAEEGFAGNINLEKTITPDDVKQALQRNMDQQGGFAGQRRGVITDDQARLNAAQTALTMAPEDWIKTRPGRAFNQEQALALGDQLVKTGNEYGAMRAELQAAEANGTATDLMRAAVADKSLEFALLEGVRSGAAAEAGRALRSFRQVLDGTLQSKDGDTSKAFRAALKAIGGEDAYVEWTQKWATLADDDVVGKYRMLQALHNPSRMQKLVAWTTSNMLSGTKTLEVNLLGGAIETINRPAIELLGGRPVDAWTDLTAMGRAIGEAWGNAGTALTTGVRPSQAARALADPTKYDAVRPEAFAGKSGLIATPALRVMSATDEFMRTLNAAGGLAVAARREARATGKTVQEVLSQPPDHVLKFAQDAADAAVFEGRGTAVSEGIIKWRNLINSSNPGERAVGVGANVLFPFVHIPEQILIRGTKMLPGANELSTIMAIRKGLQSGDKQVVRDAVGRYILTDAILLAAGSQVLAGNITGMGPKDAQKRAALEDARDASGNKVWQAHSIRMGDRWVDYTNLGPVSIPLSVLSNAHEAYLESGKKPGANEVGEVFNRVAATMLDATYIKSFGDLMKGISEGNLAKAAGSLAGNTATRFVPFSGMFSQVERSLDQETKNPRNLPEYVMSRIPGASEMVPDKPSPFGGSIQQPQDVVANASPLKTSAMGQPDLIAKAFADVGMAAPGAPNTIRIKSQVTGSTSPPITLTEEERTAYVQYMGDRLQQMRAKQVADPSWQRMSPQSQQKSLEAALQAARDYAETQIYRNLSPEERQRRMAEGRASLVPGPVAR